MKRIIISILFIYLPQLWIAGQVRIDQIYCENRINPIGLDIEQPGFSWQMSSDSRNVSQTAFEIQVSDDATFRNLLWKTGKIDSDQSLYVMYDGQPLESAQKYYWRVRVWDNGNRASKWSDAGYWQMGLLNANDWKAKWIRSGHGEDITQPAPLFRKEFSLKKQIRSATVFITSYGWYEAEINGKRMGDAYFTPGWTSYDKRLQYQVYDVTDMLKTGNNAIGVTIGNGWYRERYLGVLPVLAANDLSLLFQMQILYTDGSNDWIISDDTWKTSTGAILSNSLYHGQVYDGRLVKTGWTKSNFDDSGWTEVKAADLGYNNLIATYNEPVRSHETFKPVKLITTPIGEKVLDFGQNLVGRVSFKANGKAGEKIIISHSETLDNEGNFYTANLRTAKAEAVYYLSGNGEEILEPSFSFFGFRYIRIDGYPGPVYPEDFTATSLYSDMQMTGTFNCSDDMINQLQHNIQWGQKGNFIDVPTDCPQRDERLGWTGDAQVFLRTAAFNMDVQNFFIKWLKDMKIAQKPNGVVPWVVPDVLKYMGGPASGWSDAVTIVPWDLYLAYGDSSILSDMYVNMKAWVDYMRGQSKADLFTLPSQFGDWLFYSPTPDDYGMAAVTDKDLISQCFYSFSTQILIKAAEVLRKKDDISFYSELLKKIKDAFLKEYATPSGRLVSDTQTAYVLALHFDMLPEAMREQAAQRLVGNIRSYENHLTTGFLGTPYLTHVLSRFGHTDVAFELLLQKTYPSWLYPVTKGATTIWERWDGIMPDGSLQTPAMNSFNHYAYGAIGDWLYRVVAGIGTDEMLSGYKEIKIKPHIGGELTFVNADLITNYGRLSSHWKIEDDNFLLEVEIPVNTNAVIYVPSNYESIILESGKPVSEVREVKALGYTEGYSTFLIGSGSYSFSVAHPL